jgi:hypothetical protein
MNQSFAILAVLCTALCSSAQIVKTETSTASDGKTQATVTVQVNVSAPEPKAPVGPAEDRSGVVVVGGSSPEAFSFGALLGPKLTARASSTGVSFSPIEDAKAGEPAMIVEVRNRGSNYLLDVNVGSFSSVTAEVFGQRQRRMAASVSWRLIDVSGANSAIASGEAKEFSLSDEVIPAVEQSSSLADVLAAKAGVEIAQSLTKVSAKKISDISVPLAIIADELTFPGIVVGADYVVRRTDEPLQVKLTGFTVLVDGIAVGTVSGSDPIPLPEGLHVVEFQRNGFEPWKQRVRVNRTLSLKPVIRPDANGLDRWKSQIGFIQGLSTGSKLTDAQVSRLKAEADSLSKSGFRVDLKVDAKEFPAPIVIPASK